MPPPSSRTLKRTRLEQTRDTRDALQAAALKVILRHGYAKASVSRITEAAGVAQGTFYSYFQSHQQLLEELLPSEGVKMLEYLGQTVRGSSENYFEHERQSILAFFRYLRKHPHFLRILTEAEIAAPSSYAQHMGEIESRYVASLERAKRNGEIRQLDEAAYRVIAEVFSGARGHIAFGLMRSGRGLTKDIGEQVATTFVKFAHSGLGDGQVVQPLAAPQKRRTGLSAAPAKDTRTHLLETAADLASEQGYQNLTIANLAKSAQVAVGTFYTHFSSRQELVDELLAHVRLDMLERIRLSVRGSTSFIEMEERGFRAYINHLTERPWFHRVESEAAVWTPESYAIHFQDIAERYVKAMRRSKENGELRNFEETELHTLAYILMAARHYISARYLFPLNKGSFLPRHVSSTYLDLVRSGLKITAPDKSGLYDDDSGFQVFGDR